nr:RagB/SusD family nutrient uptake outer membrane protein [uncultured Carboxylicivirga sp.]
MKKILYYIKTMFLLIITVLLHACSDYLDIVPDKTQELELLFDRQQQAYKALATCYSYLPKNDDLYATQILTTDELTTPIRQVTNGIEIMRGKQNVNNPLLGLWTGYSGGAYQNSLFRAINDCNIFIENIHLVPDMTDDEKEEWKAEVIFLKAYYHFLLVRSYGPVPIMDENIPISAPIDEIRVKRNTVDESFEYIVNTINQSIEVLPERNSNNLYLGRIDKVIAEAIKSRVLLYAASPLFNGNAEYYQNFVDKEGVSLFNTTYDEDKWVQARDAAKNALDLALHNNLTLFKYTGDVLVEDQRDMQSTMLQGLYNYRYMFTQKWNAELIWGNSNPVTSYYQVQAASLMKSPTSSSNEAAWQWLSPTLRMAELYYTKNGLPIDEDLSFDFDHRYDLTTVTSSNRLEAQTNQQTAILHLNREPRFYASVGFDRGFNRSWGTRYPLRMRKNEKPGGRQGNSNDYLISGYLLKKYSHISSEGSTYDNLIKYPWPIIRLAELYLNYAEALNEAEGPSQEVYDALNAVRSRVNLPDIENVWSNAELAKDVNKHLTQEGLREIIFQERLIELAFEGHRYHDIRRRKLGEKYFATPVMGWSVDETDIQNFYTLTRVGERSFITPRDYFQPIQLDEMTKNTNLVQNPGW